MIDSNVPVPVIDVFEVVKACVAAAAILTPVKVTETTLPLATTVPEAAPDATVGVSKRPDPTADAVRFPVVAVTPVPPVRSPVERTVVPTMVFGVVLPIGGGAAKSAVEPALNVAGETYA